MAGQISGVDLLEWRLDFLADSSQLAPAVQALRAACPLPVLATFRTVFEGGAGVEIENFLANLPAKSYLDLISQILATVKPEGIDIEVCREGSEKAVALAREACAAVVGSYHDFASCPDSVDAVLRDLQRCQLTGADVLKVAYMPHSPQDTLTLLRASLEAKTCFAQPCVVIGMGELGRMTRLAGPVFGNTLSFVPAYPGQGTAPGQLPTDIMHALF